MDAVSPIREVCRHGKEGHFQVANLSLAKMFFQTCIHAMALDHADHGDVPIAERIAFNEALANAVIDFSIVPAHGDASSDHSAH